MKNQEKFFPEKIKVKTPEQIAEEKYVEELNQQYAQILTGFSEKNRPEKERLITETFRALSQRLGEQEGFTFGAKQKATLKTKLGRHFRHNETIDTNTLFDAIIESPKFINTDKGSLHHLLEVHEQKTILKIAEMRKRRAEMTGEKGLNPYEALFTTKDGKGDYYLARLLNMPHLEKESEHMEHCVGTSDSYVNRIKKGEIEIFSLRGVKNDMPALTIEYNFRTGTIEQVKKKNDEYLAPTDPFFGDALDALKQLRDTKNDQGKPREINNINPDELENFKVRPYHLLTDQGEIHFRNLKEKNPFILKAGEIKLTSDITNKDVAKLLSIFERLEFNPEQIARQPNEINKNTKAYVGKLEPGIFDKIQQCNIEHIYTTFPEGRVGLERDFEAGPITLEEFERKMEQYNKTIADESLKIQIAPDAKNVMKNKDFATLKNKEQMSLVRLKVRDLGFKNFHLRLKNYLLYDEILQRAEELGLEVCPPEVGPNMLLRYLNQPLNELIEIGMKPILVYGYPHLFGIRRDGDGLWLLDRWAGRDDDRHIVDEFVFRLRPTSH